ncbi:MAG: sulfatase, partial [Planctomycetota bacterium]
VRTTVLATESRPNIVYILADDLGWSDTTLYGTTTLYETPNVERLAARGMTFTRAYSASPLCSPTRASLLTGLHPARHGITSPTCHLKKVVLEARAKTTSSPSAKSVPVESITRLKTEYYTLAEALKDAGYATGHFGKWHLGHEPYSPLEHGFDVDVPHHPGPGPAGSYVAPWKFAGFQPKSPREHIEDRMAVEARQFLRKHRDEPFFLNYWMFSVHAPFDAKRADIEKYRGRVSDTSPQRSPTYAAMIESMDDAIGALLDELDALQLSEKTIVVFASDNGGNMYNQVDGTTPTSNAPLRGGKATMYEGGVRGPCVIIWPGLAKAKTRSDALIQTCDFYPTFVDLLKLKIPDSLRFDGISLAPILRGAPGDPERSIVTYFPHAPRVPDWLPPSATVHQGDWKLLRIFHHGADGHATRLYQLSKDVGEANDVAKQHPHRVRELDSQLDDFFRATVAVLPQKNRNFDPKKFRPQEIGKSRPKVAGRQRKIALGPTVDGWAPRKNCRLKKRDGALQIDCLGADPYLIHVLKRPLKAGKYEIHLDLQSPVKGEGQLFWQEKGVKPGFARQRSLP